MNDTDMFAKLLRKQALFEKDRNRKAIFENIAKDVERINSEGDI